MCAAATAPASSIPAPLLEGGLRTTAAAAAAQRSPGTSCRVATHWNPPREEFREVSSTAATVTGRARKSFSRKAPGYKVVTANLAWLHTVFPVFPCFPQTFKSSEQSHPSSFGRATKNGQFWHPWQTIFLNKLKRTLPMSYSCPDSGLETRNTTRRNNPASHPSYLQLLMLEAREFSLQETTTVKNSYNLLLQ